MRMYLSCADDSRRIAQDRCTKGGSIGLRSGYMPISAGLGNDVIAREALAQLELVLHAVAVLAGVRVASEQKGIGDLAAEAARNVDEAHQADDGRPGQLHSATSDQFFPVGLDNFRLTLDNEPQGTPRGDHGQWFERGVKGQTAHPWGSVRGVIWITPNGAWFQGLPSPRRSLRYAPVVMWV